MATAKPAAAGRTRTQPRRRGRLWLGLIAAIFLVVALFGGAIAGYARTGASYGARVACSCRFVGGRALDDCRKDFEPGMELVSLSEDAAAKTVTARFALVYAQTATYREGEGCVLERWAD